MCSGCPSEQAKGRWKSGKDTEGRMGTVHTIGVAGGAECVSRFGGQEV